MRPQAPLPRGQLDLAALLVNRPEIARVAERSGALEQVDDPRLEPIVRHVIEAAQNGRPIPGEGDLLDLVDPSCHGTLHTQLFAGNFIDAEDTQTILEESLQRCDTDRIEREISEIDEQSRMARERGDHDEIRRLMALKIDLRKRQLQMSSRI